MTNAETPIKTAAEAVRQLSVASSVIGNLPALPGSNGSVLLIDDDEAMRIEKAIDDSIACIDAELERLRAQVAPAGWKLVPVEPTEALLRPFYFCPPDELELAWQAMHMIAWRLQGRASPAAPAQQAEPVDYIVSVVMARQTAGNLNTQNKLYGVQAISAEEAHGKAIPLAQADFPQHHFHTACHWLLAHPPAQGMATDEHIRAAWKRWPRQGITSTEKAVEFVRYALAQAPAAEPQWQPIETAPKDLRPVLLRLPAVGGWTAGAWRGSWSVAGECWALHTPLVQDGKAVCLTGNPEPTGWMPLPDA